MPRSTERPTRRPPRGGKPPRVHDAASRRAARPAKRGAPEPAIPAEGERIQKALATAGLASRRAVEDWIREGRIKVNGDVATIGQKIHARDRITVDGRPFRMAQHKEPRRVLLYKKRVGEVVTRSDPDGRRTVFRKLPELMSGRWIAVGRLDINTSGMLLLTNDGELARRLTHPSYEVRREYAVRVLGGVDADVIARLRKGVELEDGIARFEDIAIADGLPLGAGDDDEAAEGGERVSANRWLHVALREGRNREVRRLFESQGLQVSRLIRIAYGPIKLGGGVRSGSYRDLDRDEMKNLLAAVDMDPRS
jgi:23S rRNA pseudouridine2605 synthase